MCIYICLHTHTLFVVYAVHVCLFWLLVLLRMMHMYLHVHVHVHSICGDICVSVYIPLRLCTFVIHFMHLHLYAVFFDICIRLCAFILICVWAVNVNMYVGSMHVIVRQYLSMYSCLPGWMHTHMYVCTYVCMCICMY